MLRITTETKRGKTLLRLEGKIAGPHVATLEQCWRELTGATPKARFSVDLCGVSYIDRAGKALLREMHRLGADFLAEGCLNQAIVSEISESDEPQEKTTKKLKGSPIIFYVILFSLLTSGSAARAQEPAPPATAPATTAAPTGVARLTLDQAVALAIKQNPTQQIAILSAAESVQDKNITRAGLLPQANFHVADSANRINVKAQFGGLPLAPNIPKHIGPYQLFTAGPSCGSTVFDFSLWKRYQASRAKRRVSPRASK